MARVWVAGGQGMLGQAVVGHLEALGHTTWGTGREVDIANRATVLAFAHTTKPTHIINCAAYTKVDACESQVVIAQQVNAAGPGHLAQAARALGVPIAHISTDYVFDGSAKAPLSEEDRCAPLGVYGQSKYAGEQAFWAALGADVLAPGAFIVRTSWLFGHHGPNFVTTMLRLMATKEQFGVVCDQFGRPTFCDDLAQALLALLGLMPSTPKMCASGVYHFANTGAISWYDFAQAILARAKAQNLALTCKRIQAIGTQDYPTPAQRPAYSVLCTDKIAQSLGRAPRTWDKALSAYLTRHWQHALLGGAAAQSPKPTSPSSIATP